MWVLCSLQILKKQHLKKIFFISLYTLIACFHFFFHFFFFLPKMSLCIRYYAIIVSTEAILSDLIVIFSNISDLCVGVFSIIFCPCVCIEKIVINNVPLKSITNLSTVSVIDKIP